MKETHPQLADIIHELNACTSKAMQFRSVSDAAFNKRPGPSSWSAAECIEHLCKTTEAYLPLLDKAIASNPAKGVTRNFRRDIPGWLLSTMLEPPVRMKVKTPDAFQPVNTPNRDTELDRFSVLQDGLIDRVNELNGRDIGAIKILSPFSKSMHYTIYSALRVLLAHERRHLWQAERAANLPAKPA